MSTQPGRRRRAFPAPRGSRHRGRERDEDSGGYPGGPLPPDLPHEYSGGYQDQPAPGYPGEAGEGYQAGAGYLDEEALGPAYPADYPDEQDYPGYPDELPAIEYGPPAGPVPGRHPRHARRGRALRRGPPEPGRAGPAGAGPSPQPIPSLMGRRRAVASHGDGNGIPGGIDFRSAMP
jgi:hypothetical protein